MKRVMTTAFASILAVAALTHEANGWGLGHEKITEAAYKALPQAQRLFLEPVADELINEYSWYPDKRHREEVAPYMIYIDGRHFHYMPLGTPERVRGFVIRGFSKYVDNIIARFEEGDVESGAKYLGSLFHVLQDSAQPGGHALEGPHGMTWHQMNELIPPPDGSHPQFSPDAAIQLLIDHDARPAFTVSIDDHSPRLLGLTTDEIAFHLYEAYVGSARVARRVQIPAAAELHQGDRMGAIEILEEAATASAKVCADLAFTLIKVAQGDVSEADVRGLSAVSLADVEPVSVPRITRFPYRFTPMIMNASLGRYRRVYPLELWIDEGDSKERRVFDRGFSSGMVSVGYDIPAGVFSRLEVLAGIHAELGSEDWDGLRLEREAPARFEMLVKLNDQVLWESGALQRDMPAHAVSVPVYEGGRLEFVSRNLSEAAINHANQPVWAEPTLIRAEPHAPQADH